MSDIDPEIGEFELKEYGEGQNIRYKLVGSVEDEIREFELGRQIQGKNIRYFVEPDDFSGNPYHYDAHAEFIDGHYVLFESRGLNSGAMFGVECEKDVTKAEKRLRERMGNQLTRRLRAAAVPFWRKG